MKMMGCFVILFLLLAGCGPQEPARLIWTPDCREASLFQSDGMVARTRKYTFDTSTRKLSGQWTESGLGEHHAELLLSEDQSAHLVEFLERVRLDSTKHGDCATDAPELSLQVAKSSGETRHYSTNPELHSCGSPREFAVEEDVLAVLDACAALLPEPPR